MTLAKGQQRFGINGSTEEMQDGAVELAESVTDHRGQRLRGFGIAEMVDVPPVLSDVRPPICGDYIHSGSHQVVGIEGERDFTIVMRKESEMSDSLRNLVALEFLKFL